MLIKFLWQDKINLIVFMIFNHIICGKGLPFFPFLINNEGKKFESPQLDI